MRPSELTTLDLVDGIETVQQLLTAIEAADEDTVQEVIECVELFPVRKQVSILTVLVTGLATYTGFADVDATAWAQMMRVSLAESSIE